MVRPTNLILVLPTLIAMTPHWRRWLGFGIGAAPVAVFLMGYSKIAYGNPLESGYGAIGALFRWQNVPLSLASYGRWLPRLLTPIGLLAALLPLSVRKLPYWSAVLGAWALSFAAVYTFYFHTHESLWYLRFLLPAFPAVWIAALLVANDWMKRLGPLQLVPQGSFRAWLAGGLVAIATFFFSDHSNRELRTSRGGRGERNYIEAIDWMRPQLPSSSLVIAMQASGALFYYSDLPVVRWDRIEPGQFERIDAAAAGRQVYALLAPFEEERVFAEHRLSGHWVKVGGIGVFHLWRYESDTATVRSGHDREAVR
jgi:hypothetical protein